MESMMAAYLLAVVVTVSVGTLVSGCLKQNKKKKKQPKKRGRQKSKDDQKKTKEKKGSQVTPPPLRGWNCPGQNSHSAGHTPMSKNYHSDAYPYVPRVKYSSAPAMRRQPPPMAQRKREKSGVDLAIVGRSGAKTEQELRREAAIRDGLLLAPMRDPTFKTINDALSDEEFDVYTSPTQSGDSQEGSFSNAASHALTSKQE